MIKMLLPVITLLALILGAESQQRLFFGNPLITVTRTSTTTVSSTLFPTCFEVKSTTACSRKKKQIGFLVNPLDYYYGIAPQPVHYGIHHSIAPDYRFLPAQQEFYNTFPLLNQAKPVVEPSFEKAEGQSRFFGSSLIKFTTILGTATVPVIAANTQTYQVSCLATGQSVPTALCSVKITFPSVPAGATLKSYCDSLASAAKMQLVECKYASRRKRQSYDNDRNEHVTPVIVVFAKQDGGPYASREAVAKNLVAFCNNASICKIGGVDVDLGQVKIPGFDNIFTAAGSSSSSAGSGTGK